MWIGTGGGFSAVAIPLGERNEALEIIDFTRIVTNNKLVLSRSLYPRRYCTYY